MVAFMRRESLNLFSNSIFMSILRPALKVKEVIQFLKFSLISPGQKGSKLSIFSATTGLPIRS